MRFSTQISFVFVIYYFHKVKLNILISLLASWFFSNFILVSVCIETNPSMLNADI